MEDPSIIQYRVIDFFNNDPDRMDWIALIDKTSPGDQPVVWANIATTLYIRIWGQRLESLFDKRFEYIYVTMLSYKNRNAPLLPVLPIDK